MATSLLLLKQKSSRGESPVSQMAHCVAWRVGHLAFLKLSLSLFVSLLTFDPFAMFADGPVGRHVVHYLQCAAVSIGRDTTNPQPAQRILSATRD